MLHVEHQRAVTTLSFKRNYFLKVTFIFTGVFLKEEDVCGCLVLSLLRIKMMGMIEIKQHEGPNGRTRDKGGIFLFKSTHMETKEQK